MFLRKKITGYFFFFFSVGRATIEVVIFVWKYFYVAPCPEIVKKFAFLFVLFSFDK